MYVLGGPLHGLLLFENQRGTADALPMKVDIHFNAVGDPDEWNAAIHPELLAIEGHDALNLAYACPLT
jgi:hypothetical protein